MLRRTTLAAALVAAAATFLVAPPAHAASYVVSLSADALNADVGEKVTLSGKVGGTGAVGRTVYLQRQSSNGAWGTVATTTTNSARAYSKAVTIPAAGTNAYRAVVNASSTVAKGTSLTRTVTGWTWLNLTDQPHATAGDVIVGNTFVVAGRNRARNIELSSGSSIFWVLDGHCDRSDIAVTRYDGSNPMQTVPVSLSTDDGGTTYFAKSGSLTPANNVTAQSASLELARANDSGPGVVVTTPRVHCDVPRLPSIFY